MTHLEETGTLDTPETLDTPNAFDIALARGAEGSLRAFNEAGILSVSDVHVAQRLARLGGTADDAVRLGAALAVRAPRLGHVCVDLHTVAGTASADTDRPTDISSLPWPDPEVWVRRMGQSPLVGRDRPLHLEGASLYLDRLWSDELLVARDLRARSGTVAAGVDAELLAAGLATLFGHDSEPDLQMMAAATAVLRNLAVVAGGPGTGKTTTVARVLALVLLQSEGGRLPRLALAAPTGKAAARLQEAVRTEAAHLPLPGALRAHLDALEGVTLHRLLGFSPGNRTRFRHNRDNRLPHDVVVVDETSMVSLSLMARLVEAVRPDARLVLVGDPEQLASVEAGAVLGDIVGPVSRRLRMGAAARARLEAVTGQPVPATVAEGATSFGDGIVVLRRLHRFGGAIAELAGSIQRGDADAVVSVLRSDDSSVQWVETETADAAGPGTLTHLEEVRALAVGFGRRVIEAARGGDPAGAIAALGGFRLLCAHRHGPEGVDAWMQQVESWLGAEVEGFLTGNEWYVGRPLLVTENDYALQLYNGDTGVVVERAGGRLVAAFPRAGAVTEVSPARLAAVDTVYAMTVHKSQGSQFEVVAFVVPGADSRVLTRELLYTAATRARERLIVVGPEDSIRAAVGRPIARASGLRRALWDAET